MKVEVYADVVCAVSRLAAHRFHCEVTSGGYDVELVYRPFELDSEASGSRLVLDVLGEMFGGREAAAAMLGEMTALGASEGVEYNFDTALAVNTFDAHRVLWLALRSGPDVQGAVATGLFDAHFRDGKDLSDHGVLAEVAGNAGLDAGAVKEFLASGEGADEVREQQAKAREAGITSVPVFVFENGDVLRAPETEDIVAALQRAR